MRRDARNYLLRPVARVALKKLRLVSMASLSSAKRVAHGICRSLGFDVFRLANLDRFLDNRERERRDTYLAQLARARQTKEAGQTGLQGSHAASASTAVSWVPAEDLLPAACARLQAAHTVLDVGCGIHPQRLIAASVHICCEPFWEYLHRVMVETAGDPRYVFVNAGIDQAMSIFPPQSVDTVFLLDVVEHLDKPAGTTAIAQFKRTARQQVVVFTPVGFMPQHYGQGEADSWGMQGGAWQEHRSAWLPEDFPAAEGWEVVACRDFHRNDANGSPLPEPCGAMWAVWTHPAAVGTPGSSEEPRR